ncbi:MAG: hypothetical protein M3153_09620 [Chloroflexota bacterium]|nr:hypothetical protein [Chloroflexota bacterium]
MSKRTAAQVVFVMMLIGLTGGLVARRVAPVASPPASGEQGDVLGEQPWSPFPAPATHVVEVGFEYPPDLADPPTADKNQSKLWYHNTSWWGVLASRESGSFTIHRLDWSTRRWIDTGVPVDDRLTARADVLWDGTYLYIASAGTAAGESEQVRLSRYSYSSLTGTHELESGFPVVLSTTGVRGLTVTEHPTGGVWVSYILDGRVWIRHSRDDGVTWGEPFSLGEAGDDVVAHTMLPHGPQMVLISSNRADGSVEFASHDAGDPPGSWSQPVHVLESAFVADDHITAGSLAGPEGSSLFVMVKTSRDLDPQSDPNDPQMLLLEKPPVGDWRVHLFGRIQDRHTRPLLVIEENRRILHLFAISPFGSGSLFYKTTSADDIRLEPGRGAPFLDLPDHPEITNPTSTKQNVNGMSGLVVLASDLESEHYVTGALPLHGPDSR